MIAMVATVVHVDVGEQIMPTMGVHMSILAHTRLRMFPPVLHAHRNVFALTYTLVRALR